MNQPTLTNINPLGIILTSIWRFAGTERKVIIGSTLLLIAAQLINLLEPYLLGTFMNAVQGGERRFFVISIYLLSFFGLFLAFSVLHYPARVLEKRTAFRVRLRCKQALFTALTDFPLAWHRDRVSGDSIERVNRASSALFMIISDGFSYIYTVVKLFGTLGFLLWFSPWAGLIATSLSVLIFLIIILFDRVLIPQYREIDRREARVTAGLFDYLSNIVTVLTLRVESLVQKSLLDRQWAVFPIMQKNVLWNEWKWFFASGLVSITTVGVLLLQAQWWLAEDGTFLVGDFFIVFEYLRRLGSVFGEVAARYGSLVACAASISGVDEILKRETGRSGLSPALPEAWQTLEVRDLSFRYQDELLRQRHLDSVSMKLRRGSRIALVGESGSGKSTLLRLMRGLDVPDSGVVWCDGISVESGLNVLVSHSSLIPQDPEIFADSIRYNVSLGIENGERKLHECLAMAAFSQVLSRLSNGLDTNIAERGVNLSGGEKQRLALARGIFFADQSDILLLDEPTSSVDGQTERLIYQSIFSAFPDKVIVSSLHKLHLLDQFDTVYVLAQGRVVEHGETAVLLKKSDGVLAQMVVAYERQGSNSDSMPEA